MHLFFAVLQILNLFVLGYVLATRFLVQEHRLWVFVPFGLTISTCLYGYALVINRYIFDWPGAIVAANLELLVVSAILGWPLRRAFTQSRLTLGMTRRAALTIALFVTIVGLLTWLVWTNDASKNASQITSEARFWHGGFTASIARGNFPPHHTLEPDYHYFYRWPYHTQAAALSHLLDTDSPTAMGLLNVWAMMLMCATVLACLLRQRFSVTQAVIATMIFVFAGTASWMLAVQQYVATALHSGGKVYTGVRNFLTGGSNFDMVQVNVTTILGYLSFLAAFWFWLEWSKGHNTRVGLIILSLLVAYLAASGEALLLVFLAAIGFHWVLVSVMRRRVQVSHLVSAVALGVIGIGLSMPLQGVMTGFFWRPEGASSPGFTLNMDHLGSIVTAPLAARTWAPIISGEFLFFFGFVPVLLMIVVLYVWRARSPIMLSPSFPFSVLLLQMGGWAFVAAISFYPVAYPYDQYRLTQISYVFLAVGCYLALSTASEFMAKRRQFGVNVLLTILIAIWVVPTVHSAIGYAMSDSRACVSESDNEAARYFGSLSWAEASRVLVLNGAPRSFVQPDGQIGDQMTLYGCSPSSLMSVAVLQYGGMGLPLGQDNYGRGAEINPVYQQANRNLDTESLRWLGIDHIYTNPLTLSADQKIGLDALRAEGLIHEAYNRNGRVIYRLSSELARTNTEDVQGSR